MAEKTEKATPKKMRDARKKGQVAKAQDLPSAFTFIASIAVVMGLSTFYYNKLGEFTTAVFKSIAPGDLSTVIVTWFYQSIIVIGLVSLPVLCLVTLVGVIVTFIAVGPVFSVEVFKPDIKKFNPIENIKQKFKFKTLFELLKSLFKIALATYFIYGVMYASMPVLVKTVGLPMIASLQIFNAFLFQVLWKVGLLFIVISIADFVFQHRTFNKEMMMEKFEVKQEYKNTEGDPLIKGKRKEIAREIAYSEGPASGVKRSTAVVTNPTHLAIAIAYNAELDAAPYITAMGSGEMATRIMELAKEYQVPVMRNVNLARNLWERGEIFDYVPEDTYEALAEILRWVQSLKEDEEYML
jgi:type III secretion protein U